jgi:ubiquinone biosynthesis protein
MRDKAIDMMVAAVREDMESLADALYALGKPTKKVDMAAFRSDVEFLSRKYLGKSIKDIEMAAMIRDLVGGAIKHGIDMPPDFLMVGKAIMTVEGIGRQLDPELDVFNEMKPHFLRIVAKRYSPEKIGNDLLRGVMRLSGVAGNMPEQVGEILDDLRKGHLTVKTTDPALANNTDRLGRQVYAGLTVGGMIVGGAVMVTHGGHVAWGGYGLFALAVLTSGWHQVRGWWTSWQLRGR